ncbi:hypothetical protein AAMO2058_001315000 [Amorphochlora amoebiformis]
MAMSVSSSTPLLTQRMSPILPEVKPGIPDSLHVSISRTRHVPLRRGRRTLLWRNLCLPVVGGVMEIPKNQRAVEQFNTIYFLLAANMIVFFFDHILHWRSVKGLYFYHWNTKWWQYVTSSFCHASWDHLSNNLFMLYAFGKMVEEEEGGGYLLSTYVIAGVVSCAMSKVPVGK